MRRKLGPLIAWALCLAGADAQEVLLVDKALMDPVAFQPFFEDFPQEGMALRYRRYHPTLVAQDTAAFDVIAVAGGLHPRSAATHLVPAEARLLTAFARAGGTVVFLFGNGPLSFGNEYVARNHTDNYLANTVLDSLGVALRIEGDSIDDPTGLKSTIKPWFTWLGLPWVEVAPGSTLGEGIASRLAMGRVLSIMVGPQEGIEVPAWTAATSMRRVASQKSREREPESLYAGAPRRYAAIAAAPAGAGHVIVAARYLFNMNGYTGRWSDKPLTPPYDLPEQRRLARNFARYVGRVARGEHESAASLPIERLERIDGIPEGLRPEAPVADRALPTTAPEGAYVELLPFAAVGPHIPRRLAPADRVRSGYVAMPPPELARTHCLAYRRAGLELLYAKVTEEEGSLVDAPSRAFLAACAEAGIRVMLWDYFALGQPDGPGITSGLVDGTGAVHGKASPFDPGFWEVDLQQKARRYARIAAAFPETVVGMMWDLEVYGHDELLVTESSAFDKLSFAVYLERRGQALGRGTAYAEALRLRPEDRFDWLERTGRLADYYGALEEEVHERARRIRDEVAAQRPGLLWGFYTASIPQSWYYRGLYRGFGEGDELLLITYEARGAQQVDYYRSALGLRLAHAPGVVFGLPRGDEWGGFLGMCLEREAGYWIYRPEPLAGTDAQWRDEGLPDTRAGTIERIRAANDGG